MIIFQRFSLFVLALLSLYSSASELADQRLVFRSTNETGEYRLTLGAIKNVNAALVADREVVVTGQIDRSTFEFVSGLKYHEAWDLIVKELRLSEYRELFSCDSLSCGSSNAWANSRFEIKQLYGLDQTQKYRAYALESEAQVEYLVLYFVQRGNKRIYAQVDRITSKNIVQAIPESYSTIVRLIDERGYYSIPIAQDGGGSELQLDLVARALKIKPLTRFYVVGHCLKSRNHEANRSCADDYANKVHQRLTELGIPPRRLDVKAVGELAPSYKKPSDRVELVVIGAKT